MRFGSVWAAALVSASGALAAGCATLPEYTETELTTALVLQKIRCEIRDAAWQKNPQNRWLKDWNVAVTATFTIFHKGGLTADPSISHPLTPGTFLLPLVLSGSGEATRTEKISFKDSLLNLNEPNAVECHGNSKSASYTPLLAGELGIVDLFNRARLSKEEANTDLTGLDYSLNFRIAHSGSVGPRFSLIPVGINTLTAGLKLEANREATHNLNIALLKNPQKIACPFPALEKKYGLCPNIIVNVTPDGKPVASVQRLEQDDDASTDNKSKAAKKPISPGQQRVLRYKAPVGISRDASQALDNAQTRSILQDTLEEIRRRGITTP